MMDLVLLTIVVGVSDNPDTPLVLLVELAPQPPRMHVALPTPVLDLEKGSLGQHLI